MTDLPFEKRFHFGDGSSVGTLEELAGKLEHLSYQEFYRHVNQGKNDFANWIRHVLKEEELATDLEKVQSIVETSEILNDFAHPRPIATARDDLQSKIEEDLGIHVPVEEVPTTESSVEVSDEPANLEIIDEGVKELEEPKPAEDPKAEAQETHDRILSESDYTRMIVKDFVYGMIFGIIVGIIIGKIV